MGRPPAQVTFCGQCRDYGKTRKMRGLGYLCPTCRKADQGLKKRYTPIEDSEEAKATYELYRSHSRIGSLPDYDTLKAEFEPECVSFKEIGIRYGFSGERIRQIYKRYFSLHIPRRPDGRIRRIICTRKIRILKRAEKHKNLALNNPAIFALKSIVESLGLEIRIISMKGIGGRIVSVAGRRCSIYSCSRSFRPSSTSDKCYWTFSLYPLHLKNREVVILMAKDSERFKFFIVPAHRITDKFSKVKKITLYVPQKMVDPWCRTGRKGTIEIYQYENRFDFLGGPRFVIKKAVPKIQVPPVLSSPA